MIRLRKSQWIGLNWGLVVFGLTEVASGTQIYRLVFEEWPFLLRIMELPAVGTILASHSFIAWLPFSIFLGLATGIFAKYFWLLFIVPPSDLRPLRLPAMAIHQPEVPPETEPVAPPARAMPMLEHLRQMSRVCPGIDVDGIQRDLLIWRLDKKC